MAGSRRTEWIRQGLAAIADDLDTYSIGNEDHRFNAEIAESVRWRIEMMLRDMFALDLYGELTSDETQSLNLFSEVYQYVCTVVKNLSKADEPLSVHLEHAEQPPVIIDGTIGRPKFDISYTQLKEMIQQRFSVRNIADLLGVSVSTIRRRMTVFNLAVRDTYSSISDAELDYIIYGVQQQFPNWGNRLMYGHLISIGIRVQFNHVRESQSRI